MINSTSNDKFTVAYHYIALEQINNFSIQLPLRYTLTDTRKESHQLILLLNFKIQ